MDDSRAHLQVEWVQILISQAASNICFSVGRKEKLLATMLQVRAGGSYPISRRHSNRPTLCQIPSTLSLGGTRSFPFAGAIDRHIPAEAFSGERCSRRRWIREAASFEHLRRRLRLPVKVPLSIITEKGFPLHFMKIMFSARSWHLLSDCTKREVDSRSFFY